MEKEHEPPNKSWQKSPAILSLLAALALVGSLVGAIKGTHWLVDFITTDIEQRAEDRRLLSQAVEKSNHAYEAIIEISNQLPDIAENAAAGAEFAGCWPNSICDPKRYPSSLPADNEQFERLDAVETFSARIHAFLKKHCQGHRDQQELFSDCTEL